MTKKLKTSLIPLIKNKTARVVAACTGGVLLSFVVFLFIVTASQTYGLHPSINESLAVIPEDVRLFLQVKDAQGLAKTFKNSKLGKRISTDKSWQGALRAPELKSLHSFLYLLNVKADLDFDLESIASLFGSSAGFAILQDGSWLFVAKTNLKSKLGVALLSAFKSEKVSVQLKTTQPADTKDKTANPQYAQLYKEEKLQLQDDIEVSRLKVHHGYINFILMGDFLFVGSKLDAMKPVLERATDPTVGTIASLKGMSEVKKRFRAEGAKLMLYLNSRTSFAAPVIQATSQGDAIALVFDTPAGALVSAEVFIIGESGQLSEQKTDSAKALLENIPGKSAVSFVAEVPLSSLVSRFSALESPWNNFREQASEYLTRLEIQSVSDSKGFAVSFTGLFLRGKKILPQFSLSYDSANKEERLLENIFSHKKSTTARFQGIQFKAYKKSGAQSYTPSSVFQKGIHHIASSQATLHKIISASEGNRPAVADLKTMKKLAGAKEAPFHLVLNVQSIIESLLSFYSYGAAHSHEHTMKTVDRDIKPLLKTFSSFEAVHLAWGLKTQPSGRLVISEK